MAEDKNKVVEDLIKERLKIETVDRKATLDTYGLDSLDVMEFLLDLEDRLGIKFESDEIKDLKTVGALMDVIEAKIK
ncbi:MAG: acyl carrier protein [Bacilli bacterium]|jgi:acyl carrier protein